MVSGGWAGQNSSMYYSTECMLGEDEAKNQLDLGRRLNEIDGKGN